MQTDWEGLRTGDWRDGRPATAPVAPGIGGRLGQTADTKAECNLLTSVLDWVCSKRITCTRRAGITILEI